MAERRMFAKTITESDAFLDMPLSAQALYFHLGMFADDDGFVNAPKRIQRSVGAATDDLRLLAGKKFIIVFDTGVIVIKHWKINNYIQKDRYSGTKYIGEKSLLEVDANKAYTLRGENVSNLDTTVETHALTCADTECIQNASNPDTQVRLGKVRLEEDISSGKAPDGDEPHSETQEQRPDSASRMKRHRESRAYSEVVSYLNAKTGSKFSPQSKATRRLIRARLNEGFTVDDFKTVIDAKCSEWLTDERMCEYLRPITLFSTKFESYLQAATANRPVPRQRDAPREYPASVPCPRCGAESEHSSGVVYLCPEHGAFVAEVRAHA